MTTAIFSAACELAQGVMAGLPVEHAAAVPVEDLAALHDSLVELIRRTLQDPTLPKD